MPLFTLYLKMDLENLTDITTGPDMRWYMKLKFSHSGEETDKEIYVCALEETQHGKNSFHLVIKDPLNRREATVNIVKDSMKPYTEDDSGRWAPVITFDCRGIEPVEFIPGMGFTGKHPKSGTEFELDLSDDYAEFDDE
eukprot:CAMPEP_0174245518 /NCGR_PEP_ID=MMETSP0417-20130205/39458_1 /TAXON_ID=242541 /ORGANISM="Mayorella sp, Strain BSH-02190019" /LENGTH=138 /DNA_ID=CAMNT_0015325313 /DNA_START=47 /DNA_END=460 /DNA_ORIENTATION=+